jgi:hypothetical protein
MVSKMKGDSYSYAIASIIRSARVGIILMEVNRLPPVLGLSIAPRKIRRAQTYLSDVISC